MTAAIAVMVETDAGVAPARPGMGVPLAASTKSTPTRPVATTVSASARIPTTAAKGAMTEATIAAMTEIGATHTPDATDPEETATVMMIAPRDETEAIVVIVAATGLM